ncbi:MAG: hypothetical protein M3Y29_00555 [Chloroflexota bacterium]|jgi:hypothetical protein|nr:hypothetical protein [Chloroflexota bacterium]
MAAAIDMRGVPEGFVRLTASVRLDADPGRVAELLARGGPWAEDAVDHPDTPDLRRYAVDLRLRVGGESAALTTFGKAAYLDLGRPRRTAGGWEMEIAWRASTAAPLFPVFSGWLTIGPDELRVDGLYAPPGGVVGRVADRMLLHVAANGTARWLLDEINRAAT